MDRYGRVVARHRLAVALLAPPREAAEVEVLRRAVGLAEPFHVPPHLTLVPPVNVGDDDLPAALAVLRRVATSSDPLQLDVGPVDTFRPETPTLHLAVGGPDLDLLRSLRGHLRSGPFDRPDVWPFQPHVTISEHAEDATIDAGLVAFAALRQRWELTALHLLEQHRYGPDHPLHGGAHWVPVREEPFGRPSVVGRGGPEVVLRTVGTVEPGVARLLDVDPEPPPVSPTTAPLVVVAERSTDPSVLGGALGRIGSGAVAELRRVVVGAAHRRQGIGRHVLARFCAAAAERGACLVVATDGCRGFLQACGFGHAGDVLVRGL